MSSAGSIGAECLHDPLSDPQGEHPLWWLIVPAQPLEPICGRNVVLGVAIAVPMAVLLAAFFPGHPKSAGDAGLSGDASNLINGSNFSIAGDSFSPGDRP
jgi:hypothetical protein